MSNKIILSIFSWQLLLCAVLPAHATLKFEPAAPLVETGGQINISVTGAAEPVIWRADKGQFDGQVEAAGLSVSYTAPAGERAEMTDIRVQDAEGQTATLKVIVQPAGDIAAMMSPENAEWTVYADYHHEGRVHDLLLSDDGQILWVSGRRLEKRDASSGRLLRTYGVLSYARLTSDGANGLWLADRSKGLIHVDATGKQTVYSSENSALPSGGLRSLVVNNTGGLWVGSHSGLFGMEAAGSWMHYNRDNSALLGNIINDLLPDANGGLWVATDKGLAHLDAAGNWTVYHTGYQGWDPVLGETDVPANSPLLSDSISSLEFDGAGGVWAGTSLGLAHLDTTGGWTVYHTGIWGNNEQGEWSLLEPANSGLQNRGRILSLSADKAGGLWIGTLDGLAYLSATAEWSLYHAGYNKWDPVLEKSVFVQANSALPDSTVWGLYPDNENGLWIGTAGGLAHLDAAGNWTVRHPEEIGVGSVNRLDYDNSTGNLWVGTAGGLIRLDAAGNRTLYHTANSGLPNHAVLSLALDGTGGVWAGTYDGLAHLDAAGNWIVHRPTDPKNRVDMLTVDRTNTLWAKFSGGLARLDATGDWTVLPTSNYLITAMAADGAGGVWHGLGQSASPPFTSVTGIGLARLDAAGNFTLHKNTNSALPGNLIDSLLNDGQNGLWVGAEGSVAHLDAMENWTLYHANSGLPGKNITALAPDRSGGIWLGMTNLFYYRYVGAVFDYQGLARLDRNSGELTVYNTVNSGLPGNRVTDLAPDGAGGLWVGAGALTHLGFGRQHKLARAAGSADILNQKRAALIVRPQETARDPRANAAFDFMAAYAYRSLLHRGYQASEVYFLSAVPQLDINDNGSPDNGVDAPVTLNEFKAGASRRDISRQDLRDAFQWAAAQDALDQPLLVYFTAYGTADGLLLDEQGTLLPAAELDALLDAYQTATGNSVVLILEAAHSGDWITRLSGPQRLIVTSTGSGPAFTDDFGVLSLSRRYFDRLRRGDSFRQAHMDLTAEWRDMPPLFAEQPPQLGGDLALADMCLNGCFGIPPDQSDITLLPEIPSQTVNAGQSLPLAVRTAINRGEVKNVRAVITTPESAGHRNRHGFPLLPEPVVELSRDPADTNRWFGTFDAFAHHGTYSVNFIAKDNARFFTKDARIILTRNDGEEAVLAPVPNLDTLYNGNILRVHLPYVRDEDIYAGLRLPDGTLYLLDQTNRFQMFNGELPRWRGSDKMLEVGIEDWVPRGNYHLYLLRLPAGVEPWTNQALWKLGIKEFAVR